MAVRTSATGLVRSMISARQAAISSRKMEQLDPESIPKSLTMQMFKNVQLMAVTRPAYVRIPQSPG
jgi:hypothetical protein